MADTGWKSPGTVVNDNSVGTVDWDGPSYAKASDNGYAQATFGGDATTCYLKATNFNFSIPLSSTINNRSNSFDSIVFSARLHCLLLFKFRII